MGKRHKARVLALQGLYQYEIGGLSKDEILKFEWIDKNKFPIEILLFAEKLISGTINNLNSIDKLIIENLTNWEFNKISPIERNILRFSVYSLIYLTEIPFIVTINEAINIARKFGNSNTYRLVNGVLDGIKNQIDSLNGT